MYKHATTIELISPEIGAQIILATADELASTQPETVLALADAIALAVIAKYAAAVANRLESAADPTDLDGGAVGRGCPGQDPQALRPRPVAATYGEGAAQKPVAVSDDDRLWPPGDAGHESLSLWLPHPTKPPHLRAVSGSSRIRMNTARQTGCRHSRVGTVSCLIRREIGWRSRYLPAARPVENPDRP